MKLTIKIAFVTIIMFIAISLTGCKDKIIEYKTADLVFKDNYTIEIKDNSIYTGKYVVANGIVKEIQPTSTSYHIGNVKYTRGVNSWNSGTSNMSTKLQVVKSLITCTSKLYTSDEKTFQTKTGNLIYDIGTSSINFVNIDNLLYSDDYSVSLEVYDFTTYETYVFTKSAIKYSTTTQLNYKINTADNNVLSYTYTNNEWIKEETEESLTSIKDNYVKKLGSDFIEENDMYLSLNGYYVKKFTGSLVTSFPSITNTTYTIKDFITENIYKVGSNYIEITNSNDYVVGYKIINNDIYKYSYDNIFNKYIINYGVTTEYKNFSDIMKPIIANFTRSYSNKLGNSYIILGENGSEYALYNISSTLLASPETKIEFAQIVLDIKEEILDKTFILEDKKNNIFYRYNGNCLEVVKQNEKLYYIDTYLYKVNLITGTATKENLDDSNMNYLQNLLDTIKIEQFLYLPNDDVNFISENYKITNFEEDIKIVLPEID